MSETSLLLDYVAEVCARMRASGISDRRIEIVEEALYEQFDATFGEDAWHDLPEHEARRVLRRMPPASSYVAEATSPEPSWPEEAGHTRPPLAMTRWLGWVSMGIFVATLALIMVFTAASSLFPGVDAGEAGGTILLCGTVSAMVCGALSIKTHAGRTGLLCAASLLALCLLAHMC